MWFDLRFEIGYMQSPQHIASLEYSGHTGVVTNKTGANVSKLISYG